MKNIYILAITALAFTLNISAQTIKHNDSDEIIGGTVACPTEPTNYLRVFDLVNEFNITTDWTISGVSFGTEVSETADITINLYTADDVDPTGAILTLIYTGTEATTDLEISEHTLSAPVTIPAGSILVMELAEANDGIVYRVGSNGAGQTAPSWLDSETCGAGTVASFGFTNHYIMSVTGEEPTTPCQSTPAITNPISDYVVCETGSSTVPSGVFDLTTKDQEILNTLVDVTLTFHLSLADAESGTSPVGSPFETQSTTMWVRAIDDTTSNPVCYSVGVFDLIVEPTPDFSPIPAITSADDEILDGFTEFDLNSYIPEITLGNPDLTVTFHENFDNAQNGVQNLPGLYTNLSNPQTIYARVSDNNTGCYGIFAIDLFVILPPPNNLCENASALSCGMSVEGLDTSFATNTNAPDACGTALDTAPGVWHTLTIPTDGDYNVSVDTFGSVFDTKLGVFSGNCNELVCIGGNDDFGGTAQSKVLFTGAAAQTYYIYVTGFNTSSGEYDINISCVLIPPLPPGNDLCENAVLIECGSQSQGDTSSATNTNAPSACETVLDTAPGVWYTLPLPTDGDYNVSVDTFGSGFDTKLGVFSGNCNELVCIGGNDDFGGTAQSKVLFTGAAAQTYYIYVTGFGTSSGDYTLNIACEDVLDITENDFVDINIYPNPASDKVTISNPGLLELETISVYDLKGRLMIKNNMEGIESITIDTSILQSATYMIVIESKYRNIIKRLLIE